MKTSKMADWTDEELKEKLGDMKGELFNLRFQLATGQLENPMRIREVKRDIARVKTILTQRELKLGAKLS
jgi:large subunit ribosomal protein L29